MAISETFEIKIAPNIEKEGFERTQVAIKAIAKAMKEQEDAFKSMNVSISSETEKNIAISNAALFENVQLIHNEIKGHEELSSKVEQTNAAFQKTIDTLGILAQGIGLAGLLRVASDFEMMAKAGNALGSKLAILIWRFKNFNGISAPSSKTLFKITESILILTPVVIALSRTLAESEIAMISFIGQIGIVTGILLTGFTVAVNSAILSVSNFAISLGDKLIRRMEIFSASAEKAEQTTSAFTFTILGFNRVIGESTGTLDFWNEQIDKMVDNTAFGVADIQKSVALLVKEGAALGLNYKQNTKLLRIAADVAAATGRDLNDVTLRIVSGLAGQSQGLLALGINVKQSAIDHSVFAEKLGKTATELSDTEAKLVRFNEIIKQTEPLLGAAENQLDTVRGANDAYERTLENIRIKLGETNQATRAYQRTITQFAESVLDLPDSVLTIIGTFLDFGGVILKIIGVLTKYLLTIGFAVTTLSLLNTVMGTSITLQTILGSLFGLVAAKVGVQAIAVSSLSSVFLNLAIIMKGTLLVAIKFIISSIVTLTIKIATLTATILTNPLFLAGTAIAASIYLIVEAIKEIIDELGLFEKETANTTGVSREFTGVLTTLKNAARAVFGVFKDLAKLIAVGLTAPVLFAVKAWLHMKKAMADNKNEAFGIQQQIEKVNAQLEKLGEISLKAQEGFRGLVAGGTAQAAENQRIEYEKLGKATENFASKLEKVKSITSEVGAQFKLLNFGDQFDKAKNSIDVTRTAYNKLLDSFINGGKDSKVSVDDLKKGYEDLLGAFQQAKDLSQQTFDGLIAGAKRVNLELMKSSGNILQATRMENEERLKLFDKQVSNLEKIGLLSEQQEKQLADARLAIVRKNQADIDKIKQKAAQKEADFFARMQNENINLLQQEKEASGQFVAAQNIAGMMALQAHDEKIKRFVEEQKLLDENFKLSKAQLDIIKQQRDAIISKNEADVVEAAKKEQDAAQKAAGPDAPQMFGPQQVELISTAFGEGAGAMAGAASAFMEPATAMMAAAQAIVGAIQQLIDFLPNFINSVANVFNSLTSLPEDIFNALLNLENAFDNFITNFVDNLANALPKIIKSINRLSARILGAGITLAIQTAFSPKFWADVVQASVDGLIEGYKLAANDIANALGFEDIFDIKADEKLKQIGDEIQRASNQLFNVMELEQVGRGLDVADRIRNALASGSSQGASFFERLFKKIKQFGQDLWDGFKEAVGKTVNWFKEKGGAIWNGLKEKAGEVVEWMKEKGKAIWEGLQEEAGKIAEAFKKFGAAIWDGLKTAVTNAGEYFKEKGAAIWNGLKEKAGAITEFMKERGKAIWTGLKEEAGNITNAFKGFGASIWDGLKTAASDAIEDIKGWGKDIWNGLNDSIQWPDIPTPEWLQSFINAVNSLTNWSLPFSSGGLVGKVANSLPSPGGFAGQTIEKVTSFFSEGGPVTVPTGTTKNGILYAQTGSMARGTDTIPAMLTPGEFVVNREATRNNLGLLSFINQNKDAVSPSAPQNSTFNITINAKTNLDVNTLRREVLPELEKQLRRKSQEGKSVINAAGIRA